MVVMKKLHTTTQNYTSNEKCFQLQIPMNFEFIIPDNDSVRLLSQFVEEMDLTCLYDTYSILKENQVTPRQMLKILLYAYLDTKYASRVIETACKRDVNYIYLLEGKPAPDHATIARFRSLHFAPCAKELLTQCTQLLYELGEISGKKFFIDGTKMEANANKYTFVWKRKSTLQKQIEQLSHFLEKAKEYNQKIYRCGKIFPDSAHPKDAPPGGNDSGGGFVGACVENESIFGELSYFDAKARFVLFGITARRHYNASRRTGRELHIGIPEPFLLDRKHDFEQVALKERQNHLCFGVAEAAVVFYNFRTVLREHKPEIKAALKAPALFVHCLNGGAENRFHADFGDVIRVKDLPLAADKDVHITTDLEAVVASVVAVHNAPEAEEETEEAEAETK